MATKVPTYVEDKESIKKFLQDFTSAEDAPEYGSRHKYMAMMQRIANRQQTQFVVDVEDIIDFGEDELANAVRKNTRRYLTLFADVVDEIKPPPSVEVVDNTVLDVFIQHRNTLAALAQNAPDGQGGAAAPAANARTRYPPELMRRFEIVFRLPSQEKAMSIRHVDASHIGHLVKVRGIVIRATAVKPSVTVATYACELCSSEVYQQVTGPTFMPKTECISEDCTTNNRKGRLHLLTRGSRFERFQELKLQEMAADVPPGGIPRTMTVSVRGEVTRTAAPGDIVTVTGIFLPVPHQGFRQLRAGLVSDTFLEAQIVDKEKRAYSEQVVTDTIRAEIESRAQDADIYDQLAGSLCPHIYGHDDVKKALLLLLVGGAERRMRDGMHIRGDIHICLMGDPGVAKSQMLKAISDLAPRGVYTTGRGSSGVGLTAAVTRDPITNELVLEGGALVLADMGVCCIDEFDKMDEGDRTAIHEVMEQQTVSIAKAGITTTLNARSSILAAANPLYGRYNPKKSATHNINLPAALLSRFDLLFLLLDRPDRDADLRLAQHITYVHTHNDFPPLEHAPLDKDFVRNYLSLAKGYSPTIPQELTEYIVGVYVHMREEEQEGGEAATFTSARSLLSVLRLSSALARLRFSERVEQDDVEEALRLAHMSKASVNEQGKAKVSRNPHNEIYRIIQEMAQDTEETSVVLEEARMRALRRGFTAEQFEGCLAEYEELNVFHINHSRTRIELVS